MTQSSTIAAPKHHLVIYHANCPDGFGAAFAAWLKLGDTADYVPYAYDVAPPPVEGKSVYIVDFSFDKAQLDEMNRTAHKVVLLDHHQTAIDKLQNYQCRCVAKPGFLTGGKNSTTDGCSPAYLGDQGHTVLDVSRSGAALAWHYFHPEKPEPMLIRFIEDRDLWKWEYGDTSRDYLTRLDSLAKDFAVWKQVYEMDSEAQKTFIAEGNAMSVQFKALTQSMAKRATPFTLKGHQGLAVNAPPEFNSELGSLLYERNGTFALTWHLEASGMLKISLRSVAGFDVRVLAESFGGGGHPQAASFRLPASRFADLARGCIE